MKQGETPMKHAAAFHASPGRERVKQMEHPPLGGVCSRLFRPVFPPTARSTGLAGPPVARTQGTPLELHPERNLT